MFTSHGSIIKERQTREGKTGEQPGTESSSERRGWFRKVEIIHKGQNLGRKVETFRFE